MRTNKKITEKQWKKFEETLPTTLGLIGATCEKLGISRWVYYDHRKKDKEFAERCDEIMFGQIGNNFARDKLMEALFLGEGWAIRFYLSCKDPAFRPKSITELEGKITTISQQSDINPDAKKVLDVWRKTYDKQFKRKTKRGKKKN